MRTTNTIQCNFSELAGKINTLAEDCLFAVSGEAKDGFDQVHKSLKSLEQKKIKIGLDLSLVNWIENEDGNSLEMFEDCKSLKSVILPNTLEIVYGFDGCTSLENIELPENLKQLGIIAFYGCKSLKKLTISKGVIKIGQDAFVGCKSLELKSESPDFIAENNMLFNADKIAVLAVYGSPKSLIIPSGVKEIAKNAFCNCISLESVEIPSSVEEIGLSAFRGCKKLSLKASGTNFVTEGSLLLNTAKTKIISVFGDPKEIKIPQGISEIETGVFYDCTALESVEFPDSLKIIKARAFRDCISLKKVNLPASLEKIGVLAFYGCVSLGKVEIPSGCDVAENAFMISSIL